MPLPVYGQYNIPTVDECVNFKIGQPAPSMLPLEMIRKAANEKFKENDPNFLQYGNIYGFPVFRKSLSKFLTQRLKIPVDENDLMASNGITGAMSLVLSLFCKSGDMVFAEDPTYFLAKRIFEDYNLNCHQVEMEKDGVNIAILEEDIKKMKPKMMYIVPTANNPTGRTLSLEKRKKLVALAKKYNFLLLCDEVYHLLTFPGIVPPPPMVSFDPEGTTVISLGSFSKILCPALRVGWIQTGKQILKKIADCGQLDSSGGVNPVSFGIVQKCIDLGLQDKHLDTTRDILFQRYQTLKAALSQHTDDIEFEEPTGGYFVLVKIKNKNGKEIDASDVLKIALKNKVAFLPGGGFSDKMKNYLRLSFSMYDKEDIAVGVQRLIQSIQEAGN